MCHVSPEFWIYYIQESVSGEAEMKFWTLWDESVAADAPLDGRRMADGLKEAFDLDVLTALMDEFRDMRQNRGETALSFEARFSRVVGRMRLSGEPVAHPVEEMMTRMTLRSDLECRDKNSAL
jgi:hypothetical protein